MSDSNNSVRGLREQIGLVAGPLLAGLMLWAGPPEALAQAAWLVAALTVLMAVWWISEALPIAATALLPLVILPLLGVSDFAAAATPYANPVVFLFLGGFLIALGIQASGLHRRIALLILGAFGARPHRLVGGFMLATALLSMWISNTAAAALMLPIALSVLVLLEREGTRLPATLAVALMLAIAWGANIGGMGTLIGTPPNALLAAYMAEQGINVSFARWLLLGVPLVTVLLLLAWWVLVRVAHQLPRQPLPGVDDLLGRERAALGVMDSAQKRVLAVFVLVALAWVTRPLLESVWPAISDAGIALAGGLLLFLLPAAGVTGRPILVWRDTRELPWGVLVLVGGGLSLGSAIDHSGLAAALAALLQGLDGAPLPLVLLLVATLTLLLSHVTSNTATAAMLIPLAAGLAPVLDVPVMLLVVPVVLAASCAFMLPVATPPNAIVFGSERLTIPDMLRAGAPLSLLALGVIVPVALWWALPALAGGS